MRDYNRVREKETLFVNFLFSMRDIFTKKRRQQRTEKEEKKVS